MAVTSKENQKMIALRNEIKLQINQNIFDQGLISREIYELAKNEILRNT